MDKLEQLGKVVSSLQDGIRQQSLNSDVVEAATKTLADIGYQYDASIFPELKTDAEFSSTVGSQPSNLAEALLWKMGKWNVYKDFANNYQKNSSLTKQTNVVFAAFAKHLRDRTNPIYDQHALRAMWAINTSLESQEKEQCKAALFKSKGKEKEKWKATLSGRETITCYNLYVSKLNTLSNSGLSMSTLDKLLMPLGQALKINCSNYEEFTKLCGNG